MMLKLLNYERKRLVKSNCFWIILLVTSLFAVISIVLIRNIPTFLTAIDADIVQIENSLRDLGIPFRLFGSDALIFGAGDFLSIPLTILIAVLFASEFSNGTIKNVLSKGYPRTSVYLSKLISCCAAVTIIVFASASISSVFATIFWGFSDGIVLWGRLVVIFFVQLLAFYAIVSLAAFVSSIIRNTAGAVAANIVLFAFFPSILTFSAMLQGLDHMFFTRFEITNIIASLTDSVTVGTGDIIRTLCVSLVYIGITSTAGIVVFNRRDI